MRILCIFGLGPLIKHRSRGISPFEAIEMAHGKGVCFCMVTWCSFYYFCDTLRFDRMFSFSPLQFSGQKEMDG